MIAQIKKIFPELSEESDVVFKSYEITTKEATFDCVIDKYKELIDENEIEQEWNENGHLLYCSSLDTLVLKLLPYILLIFS